jgi:hypothetical protein
MRLIAIPALERNMIGIWSDHARRFLLVLAGLTTPVFAIPIALIPLRWARLMLWRPPEDRDLAVYFGRCLGAFILIVEFLMFRSALTGEGLRIAFECITLVWVFMIVVHVVGAVEGRQPITETLEIGLWALLLALTGLFWPISAR